MHDIHEIFEEKNAPGEQKQCVYKERDSGISAYLDICNIYDILYYNI